MIEVLFTIFGAALGVLFSWLGRAIAKLIKRRKPISFDVDRACVAPSWFATNREVPKDCEKSTEFDSAVMKSDPFCGFGRIDIHVRNLSNDVLYITSIDIKKKEIECAYNTRVFFMAQGGISPLRLNVVLDDEIVVLAENLELRHSFTGGYFSSGNRVKVLPGETEIIRLGFITVNNAWAFNCDVHFTIAESNRVETSVFGNDEVIVPYIPDVFKRDYNSLIEFSSLPEYSMYDRSFFSEEMRQADPERQHTEDSSSMEYLSSLI